MKNPSRRVVLGGMASLIITMGIGRFAYTPILPYMQSAQHFSDAFAGYMASSNYLGYLVGSLLTGCIRWGRNKTRVFQGSLLVNILSTGIMSTSTNILLWMVFRFVSGITSGMVFVLASSIVLDRLAFQKKLSWSGHFYSGVGMGILLTGLAVPFLGHFFTWRGTWLGLMILSMIMGIFAWHWTCENSFTKDQSVKRLENFSRFYTPQSNKFFKWILISYGLEGMGYIVSGTFMVAMVSEIPGLKEAAPLIWGIVGLMSIPSSPLWAWLAKKAGMVRSLVAAYLIQAFGVVIPILLFNRVGACLGAVLFGGTFMGITTLATSVARSMYANRSSQSIGYLTAAYGTGQVLGPIGAGILTEKTHGYTWSLVMAAFVLLLGALLLIVGKMLNKRTDIVLSNIQDQEVSS